eukprot:TRINITY_DN12980_c0_g1_i1.p1 TRINITY_DN12980_c0_g1~~TRINITY_DN12980_c0_g1_i1.p1  ORF type:complete len:338 (+),score=66.60 TRINITY_DN12980_c0_g1_i1:60-1073(+)
MQATMGKLKGLETEVMTAHETYRSQLSEIKSRYEDLLRREEDKGRQRLVEKERELRKSEADVTRLEKTVRLLEGKTHERSADSRIVQISVLGGEEKLMATVKHQKKVMLMQEATIKDLKEKLHDAEEQCEALKHQPSIVRSVSRSRSRSISEPLYTPSRQLQKGYQAKVEATLTSLSPDSRGSPPPRDVKELRNAKRAEARMAPVTGYPRTIIKAMNDAGQVESDKQQLKQQLQKMQSRKNLVTLQARVVFIFTSFLQEGAVRWSHDTFSSFISTLHTATPPPDAATWSRLCAYLRAPPSGLEATHLLKLYSTPNKVFPLALDSENDFLQLVDPQPT